MDKASLNLLIDHWAIATADQEEEQSRIPLRVLLGEAFDLAAVVDEYFEDTSINGKVRLGLRSVSANGSINEHTATEIRELQFAIAGVQARYINLAQANSDAPIERADEILGELRAGLSFVLEDNDNPQGEAQLERLRQEYGTASSHDGIAMALEGYGELASQNRAQLETLGGFDLKTIDEALNVAQAMRKRSADRLTGKVAQQQKDTIRLRNRLIGALVDRMRDTRKAVRYVFREYPEIVKKCGSDYKRHQQRLRRQTDPEVTESDVNELAPKAEASGTEVVSK